MSVHLNTALSNIRRSPFQALSALLVLVITFFILTIISILVFSSHRLISYFETRPQVIAFIKKDTKNEDIARLQNKLQNDARVKDIKYVSKEEALEIYKDATSDNPLLAELVSPSIFPASLEFSLVNLAEADQVISELKNGEIVDQVGFTANLGGEAGLSDTVSRLKTISRYLRLGGGILAGVLVFTSLVVLMVIISMRLISRRQEIEVLNLIGATSGFIRSPIILEALIYGFLGTLIGWSLSTIAVLYLTPGVISYFQEIPILPKSALGLLQILGTVLFFELIISALLAIFGSLLAVTRLKRSK